jgi:uncharacterized Ntn-hydrolase superfamily protein
MNASFSIVGSRFPYLEIGSAVAEQEGAEVSLGSAQPV